MKILRLNLPPQLRGRHLQKLRLLFDLKPEVNVNQLDGKGATPLYLSIVEADHKIFDLLLSRPNLDVNKINLDNSSRPLNEAFKVIKQHKA